MKDAKGSGRHQKIGGASQIIPKLYLGGEVRSNSEKILKRWEA